MKVNLEDIKPTEKKIDVYIPAEVVKEKDSEIFKQFRKNAKIKGFRPGKAPESVVRSLYSKSIEEELISTLVSDTLGEALKEVSLTPVTRPRIEPGKVSPDSEFRYSATFEVIPEFDITEYKGLKLKKKSTEIKLEQVEKVIEQLRQGHAQVKQVEEDRPVQKGDLVIVDFEGRLGEEVIEDLKRQDVQFLVGEGQLKEEFERNILGMRKGEEKRFDVTYDENFPIKEAAGKTVNFTLKVKEIYERILPEVNDEFAKELGYESIEELKERIKKDLVEQLEREQQESFNQQILDILDKEVDIELPSSLVEDEFQRLRQNYVSGLRRQGIEPSPMTKEMEETFRERARRNVKNSIILSKIAEKEKIHATHQEIEKRLKEIADSLNAPYEEVRRVYVENNMISSIEASIIEDKVLKFLKENAQITEESDQSDLVDNEKGA